VLGIVLCNMAAEPDEEKTTPELKAEIAELVDHEPNQEYPYLDREMLVAIKDHIIERHDEMGRLDELKE